MAMVKLEMRDGMLSGNITFTIICIGEAPILCAISMIFGFNSRRLLSTKRDEYSVLEFEVPISGAYFIKIGNYKAKKVVVIK